MKQIDASFLAESIVDEVDIVNTIANRFECGIKIRLPIEYDFCVGDFSGDCESQSIVIFIVVDQQYPDGWSFVLFRHFLIAPLSQNRSARDDL